MRFSKGCKAILIFLLVLGIGFRFVNLNHKVYWHDETYTTLRAAGYTRQEIDQTLFQNRLWAARDLQRFQQIKPGSQVGDTVRSLVMEDPQHPPLYFVMTRWWMQGLDGLLSQWFRSSLTTSRSLPALISLLALPLIYALAQELFAAPAVALLATTLLALSPFDVLFAQTARQYSLLTVMVIASQWLLLRAMGLSSGSDRLKPGRHPTLDRVLPWLFYGLALLIGLYTQPLFVLAIAAQVVYVGLEWWLVQPRGQAGRSLLQRFSLTLAAVFVAYIPWLWVMLTNLSRVKATTDWFRVSPGFDYLLKLWTLGFTAVFFDLDWGGNNPFTYLPRLLLLGLIGYGLYRLWLDLPRSPSSLLPVDRRVWLFILTSVLVPFLLLALPDLFLGGQRSAVSRYLIPCFPGLQLTVAYVLAVHLVNRRQIRGRQSPARSASPRAWSQPLWWMGSTLLILGCLASLTVSAAAFSWWNKDLSYFNNQIADRLNALPRPVLISDAGTDYTNMGDLLSLSYILQDKVQLLLLSPDLGWLDSPEFAALTPSNDLVVFRPSQDLAQKLEQLNFSSQALLEPARLWAISTK